MRHKKVVKRKTIPDKVYNNVLVAKLINRIMKNGKKTIAQKKVYETFTLLGENNQDPLTVFEKAVQNVAPKVEVKARRVGGANYQVPVEVRQDRKIALAIRWITDAAKKRSSKDYHTFEEKLAAEINDATQNLGEAVKKRDTMSRQAEANRAFAHFRW